MAIELPSIRDHARGLQARGYKGKSPVNRAKLKINDPDALLSLVYEAFSYVARRL